MKTTLKFVGLGVVGGLTAVGALGVLGFISASYGGVSLKDVMEAAKKASTPI